MRYLQFAVISAVLALVAIPVFSESQTATPAAPVVVSTVAVETPAVQPATAPARTVRVVYQGWATR